MTKAACTNTRKQEVGTLAALNNSYGAGGDSGPTSRACSTIGQIQSTVAGRAGTVRCANRAPKRTLLTGIVPIEVVFLHALEAIVGIVAGEAVILARQAETGRGVGVLVVWGAI